MTILVTPSLELRPLHFFGDEILVPFFNDIDNMHYFSEGRAWAEEETREFVKEQEDQWWHLGYGIYGVIHEARFIGIAGLHCYKDAGFISPRCLFTKKARGQKLGREALAYILDNGFFDHGIQELVAHCHEENGPAKKFFKNLGFRDVGPRYIKAWDMNRDEFRMTKEEWITARQSEFFKGIVLSR